MKTDRLVEFLDEERKSSLAKHDFTAVRCYKKIIDFIDEMQEDDRPFDKENILEYLSGIEKDAKLLLENVQNAQRYFENTPESKIDYDFYRNYLAVDKGYKHITIEDKL